jgi:hypothetical protein
MTSLCNFLCFNFFLLYFLGFVFGAIVFFTHLRFLHRRRCLLFLLDVVLFALALTVVDFLAETVPGNAKAELTIIKLKINAVKIPSLFFILSPLINF